MCWNTQGLYKCGKCPECLGERRTSWSLRLISEHRKTPCFSALLTYDNYNVPLVTDDSISYMSLSKRDVQLFLKRLRHEKGFEKFKYFIAGEYSPEKLRPHYHCLFFGFDKTMEKSKIISTLQKTWRKGFVGSRSNWIKDDAQIHYVTSYIINLFDWKKDDVRELPFNLISKGLSMTCSWLSEIRNENYKHVGFEYVGNGNYVFHSPLVWNPDKKDFDLDDDFVFNIDTVQIQQTHFNPRTKKTTIGKVQSFPMPRVWKDRYLTSAEKDIINVLKHIKAYKRQTEYVKKYGEYDKNSNLPMWKLKKINDWKHKKKNKKDKLLSNPDMYLL